MKIFKTTALLLTVMSSIAMADAASIASSESALIYKVNKFTDLKAAPSFSLAAPAGLVPGYGVVFAGVSGRTNSNDTDGAMAVGMGFGDPNNFLGGAATLSLGSIDPRDGGAFNRGTLNLTTGKNFIDYNLGVAVGVSNIDLWHNDSKDDFDPSFYSAVTKLFPELHFPVILNAGFGNNIYSDSKKANAKDKWGAFGSAAVYLIPQVSLIADYTGGITTLGMGLSPFPKLPVSFTIGASDVFKYSNENKVSFIAGISAAYTF